MIGRAEWFTRRKYSGWGLTPKTWQGIAYIGGVAGITFLLTQLPLDVQIRMVVIVAWTVLIIADVLHMMATMKMDERETKIEAIAERNASWTMVFALALSMVYFISLGSTVCGQDAVPFLVVPMVAGLAVKAISNFMLQKSEI